MLVIFFSCLFFFFNDTATTEIYTLSLHDALPTSRARACAPCSMAEAGSLRVLVADEDRKSTRLNSSHVEISYAVFCLKKKKKNNTNPPDTKRRTTTDNIP